MAAGRDGLGGLSWAGLGGLSCAGLLCDALRVEAKKTISTTAHNCSPAQSWEGYEAPLCVYTLRAARHGRHHHCRSSSRSTSRRSSSGTAAAANNNSAAVQLQRGGLCEAHRISLSLIFLIIN